MSNTTFQIPATEAHKRDCLARYYLDNKSREEIKQWLEKLTAAEYREDMRQRFNQQRARLKYCRAELVKADQVTWHWLTDRWTLRELKHCMKCAPLDAHGQTALKMIIDRKEQEQNP
ncbi:hypothetical protein [Endozoicomonas ascidiicola]|uniref:hypothetical protein n=1 Tax=Endozoicomonas ascidiicola TaxID=1698521 RepID=UPI000831ADD7|nr:hypothetical protein [Endozoicomonas ascidiicola]